MDNQTPKRKIILIILAGGLFFFVVTGIILFLTKKGEKKEKKQLPPFTQISPTIAPTIQTKGYLKLTTGNNLTRFPVNQPMVLQLLADSAGEEIVGFDVLISYDSSAFDFERAVSLLSDFKVYSFKRQGYLALTAVKSLQSKTPSVFRQTPVLTVSFVPKIAGEFTFVLKEKIGKETTGLMTNKTKRLTPVLEGLTVKIHQ